MEKNRSLEESTPHEATREQYRSIPIRSDLPRIVKSYQDACLQHSPPNEFWLARLNRSSARGETSTSSQPPPSTPIPARHYEIQYSITNGAYTSHSDNHPILAAFLRAYNSHEDVILSPDDIWLMICIYFGKYANQHADKLGHWHADANENKSLTIENEQTIETNWEYFLHQVHQEMTHHVKNDLCHLLKNNFSTTTKVESLLSSLAIMSTFKKCWDYTYATSSCGIRNVHFLGTLADWQLLRDKADQLRNYTIETDDFFAYLEGILPILEQFIRTYEGDVDNAFWDTIFDLNHANDQSNQSDGTNVNGWFLRLCYGNHGQASCAMTHVELNTLLVPVIVDDEPANTSKTCYLVGGFHGVRSNEEKHKPVMSLIIMDDVITMTTLQQ